ncbi:MAG: gamma-glutamyl-gamma-aminobutyrate hydrolase family protein [Vitreoscilla sp.]|nr:gamma-glutamyl-gamma-aminobutyrate hydrolase family protein [Vitreoscilla sp.]
MKANTEISYKIELINGFRKAAKPVLGICRGEQLINVAFGGTLIQDIPTQLPHASRHVDAVQYDDLSHGLSVVPDSSLAAIYKGSLSATVNSIHHQAVDRLGAGLGVEARCSEDGLVEAIRSRDDDFILGVQWHPEFHWHRTDRLPPEPLLDALLFAARRRALR